MVLTETNLLKRIATLANLPIRFLDEKELPGTCIIGELPIDITIKSYGVYLNLVGYVNHKQRNMFKGKGLFKALIPHIKMTLTEYGFKSELYLCPTSPVWKNNYNLMIDENGISKIIL